MATEVEDADETRVAAAVMATAVEDSDETRVAAAVMATAVEMTTCQRTGHSQRSQCTVGTRNTLRQGRHRRSPHRAHGSTC